MTYLAKKPCSHPGCPELTRGGPCEAHKKQRTKQYDDDRGTPSSRGYDHAWQKVRRIKLARNPLCECSCGRLADTVHHIESVEDRPDLRLKMSNLMSLTRKCHEDLERKIGKRFGGQRG